jgi:hypothetical protein
MHNINQNLIDLAVDVSLLDPLPGNPRIGNVDAIMASYSQFGQLKPIVIKEQEDGRYVVVAGNHQLQAVRKLGWSQIAAVKMEGETSEALAFALVDNRVADLGKTADKTTESFGKDKTRGFRGFIGGYGNVSQTIAGEDGKTRAASAAERTNMRQMNRMNFSQKMMPAQMLGMAVPMAAGMYAQKNPEQFFLPVPGPTASQSHTLGRLIGGSRRTKIEWAAALLMIVCSTIAFLQYVSPWLVSGAIYLSILAIPILLAGRSVVGISETGSGKTLAYALPLLHEIGRAHV